MKKFTKVCLISAVILVFLGTVVLASAVGISGFPEILSLARAGELGIIAFQNDDYNYNYNYDYDYDYEDEYDNIYNKDGVSAEISGEPKDAGSGEAARTKLQLDVLPNAEDISVININYGAGMLYLRSTDEENFRIETNYPNIINCYREGEQLILADKDFHEGMRIRKRKLYLYIPETVSLDRVKIDLGAGMMEADELFADYLEVNIGAGRAELEKVEASESSFAVAAGQLTIEDGQLGNSDFSVGAGQMEFSGTVTGNLEVDCDMGNISMDLTGSEKDHNYQMEAAMGSINFDGRSVRQGDSTIHNDAASHFDLSVSMGTIDLDFDQ